MTKKSKRLEERAVKKAVEVKAKVEQVVDSIEEELTTDDEASVKRVPFRFFDLPSELRLRVYEELLTVKNTLDLDPLNYRRILPLLSVFRVNHRMHDEAYRVFYGQTFRLFPTHGRFFHTKKPLLARLPPRYRNAVHTIELRLGPGWSAPPKGQKITQELGLQDCTALRTLRIFIELDPSEAVFAGFRGKNATEDTYKNFCIDLLSGIFEYVPSISIVAIDTYPAVKRDSPLVTAISQHCLGYNKLVAWESSKATSRIQQSSVMFALEELFASMAVEDTPRLIEVGA